MTGVPGRMERIDVGQPFAVVVDYAHTADALAKVLDELAPVAAAGGGALIAVFGSAGDRDRVKRPAMGRVAGTRCRLVVVTDEDPRTEDRLVDPRCDRGRCRGGWLPPRPRPAPRFPTGPRRSGGHSPRLGPGDVVLLAGKGHEKTIEMARGDVAWDEGLEARRALLEAGWGPRP